MDKMNTVGEIIKSKRISKNCSIADAAYELKISKNIIEKIETDEISKDYDIVFYIGHLRSYCNFLNLNSNEIINIFKEQNSYNKIKVVDKISKPKIYSNSLNYLKFFPISMILIIFVSFYILFLRENNYSKQYALVPDLPESYIPIIEQTNLKESKKNVKLDNDIENYSSEAFNSSSAFASTGNDQYELGNKVILKLINPTWLQLRDKSNNIIISKLMDKNEEFSYDLSLNYRITAGNAGNILVIINSDVRGKIGKYGDVVDSLIIESDFNN